MEIYPIPIDWTDATEALSTTQTGTFGTLTVGSGSITDSDGAISFGNETITTDGAGYFGGGLKVANNAYIGNAETASMIGLIGDPLTPSIVIPVLLKADTIGEVTADAGVTIDSVELKDGGITLPTTSEINFRDTDISMGSTLADGILDMSADGSIRMFYDNADVGDAVAGQSLYVYRRAAEGDDYARIYVAANKRTVLEASYRFEMYTDSVRIAQYTSTGTHYYRNLNIVSDEYGVKLGEGYDAIIYYNGTNLIIDPKLVGTGYVNIQGALDVDETITTAANQAWNLGAASAQADFAGDTKIRVTIGGTDYDIVAKAA